MRVSNYEEALVCKEISYFKLESGEYLIYFPDKELLGNLKNHQIIEHVDGTITVSPSILVTKPNTLIQVHGFLTKGIWEDC